MASGPTSTPTVGEQGWSSTPKPGAVSGGRPELKREKNANVKGDAKANKEKFGGRHPFDDIPELPPVPEELLPKIIAYLMMITTATSAKLKEVHDESKELKTESGKVKEKLRQVDDELRQAKAESRLAKEKVRQVDDELRHAMAESRLAKNKLRQIDEELRQAKSESHREKGKVWKLEDELRDVKGEQRQTMGVLTKMQKQLSQCEDELLQLKKPAKEDSEDTFCLLFGDMTGIIFGGSIMLLGLFLGSALAEKRK